MQHFGCVALVSSLVLFAMSAVIPAQDCDDLYREGERLFIRGAYEEAVRSLDRAIDFGLREKRVYRCRGFARLLAGRPEMAVADFTQAIRLDAKDAGLYYGRGVAHYFRGNLRGASEDLAEALRLYPNYLGASMLRLEILSECKDDAGWFEEWRRGGAILERWAKADVAEMSFGLGRNMVRFNETGPVGLEHLLPFECWNLVFREWRSNAGMTNRRAASVRADVDENDLYVQSVQAAAQGDLDGSLGSISAAIVRAPASWRFRQMRGAIWALKGDLRSALADLTEAIRLNGSDPLSYRLRSSIYRAMKEWEKAAADTDTVIELGEQKLQLLQQQLEDHLRNRSTTVPARKATF